MTKPKVTKIDRKKIAEAILAERLGLNEEWIDRWERRKAVEGVSLPDQHATELAGDEVELPHPTDQLPAEQVSEWVEESSTPDQLPEFIRTAQTKSEIADVEAAIDRLVAAGCSRRVIYFCLEQLSRNATEIRSGVEWTVVPSKDGGDDSLFKRQRKLATSEDLETVVNTAKEARKQIHRYQRELLFVADTRMYPLPQGMTTQFEFAEAAIDLLEFSLTWIAKLAEAYTAPMETTLLKSKGLLYLTLYVSMYADSKKLRSSKVSQVLKDSARASEDVRARREISAPGNALAEVANACESKTWSSSDLHEKLNSFKADHPRLYNKLKSKLIELHQFSTR
jgi:hypothetical protein